MTIEDEKDMIRHVMMFGPGAICRPLGKRWTVEWRNKGFPTVFHSRAEAIAKAREWIHTVDMRHRSTRLG